MVVYDFEWVIRLVDCLCLGFVIWLVCWSVFGCAGFVACYAWVCCLFIIICCVCTLGCCQWYLFVFWFACV